MSNSSKTIQLDTGSRSSLSKRWLPSDTNHSHYNFGINEMADDSRNSSVSINVEDAWHSNPAEDNSVKSLRLKKLTLA